jgi:hypothetical protein
MEWVGSVWAERTFLRVGFCGWFRRGGGAMVQKLSSVPERRKEKEGWI